jgi:ribosomal-protein-alanine N-acetyltransferase
MKIFFISPPIECHLQDIFTGWCSWVKLYLEKIFTGMAAQTFPSFVSLETPRLLLRRLANRDVNEVFLLRSDKQHNQYINRPLASSIDDAQSFINKIDALMNQQDTFFWAISLKNEEQLAGTITLWNLDIANHKAEVGYELLGAYQGKGIMKEAVAAVLNFGFDQLKLNTIEACTHPDNEQSISLLKKFNFKPAVETTGNIPPQKEIVYVLQANDHLYR